MTRLIDALWRQARAEGIGGLMDPDVCLMQMRQAIRDWEAATPGSKREQEKAEQATSAASALDDWLSKGGFPPADWTRLRTLSSVRDLEAAARAVLDAWDNGGRVGELEWRGEMSRTLARLREVTPR